MKLKFCTLLAAVIMSVPVALAAVPVIGNAGSAKFPELNSGGKTAIVAHRGFWNCDDAGFSQNSIASLKAAQQAGFWGSEFDVNITKDGVVIVNHDNNIEGKVIAETNWKDLQVFLLPNGERRPTLEEYLLQGKEYPGTMLVLEFKDQPDSLIEDRMVEESFTLLKKLGMFDPSRVMFISFSLHVCKKIASEAPQFINQYLNGELTPQELSELGINGWDYHQKVVSKNPVWVEGAHALGMSTNVWTVNKEANMKLFIEMGLDAITTNEPLLARELLGNKENKK